MLSRLKFTLRSTVLYSIGSISIKIIGLILLPIYTDKLSPEQYGMWSILEITSQVLILIIGLRMSTGMLRFYSSEKDDVRRGKVIFTAFVVSFLSVIVFTGLSLPFSRQFSILFYDSIIYAKYFHLLFIWVGLEIYNKLLLDLIRINEKPGFFITITIVKFIIVLIIIIYLIVYRDKGIEGILLGQIIGSIAVLLVSLPFVLKRIYWSVDIPLFKQMFKYCFPLIFSGIASLLLAVGDRYIIKVFLDYDEVGIYSLGYKISNLLKMIFIQAFQLGFLPIAFNMYDKPNSKRFFSKVFTYYSFVLFWSGLAISLFSKEIIVTFASNPAYFDAYKYVPLQTLSVCFFGIQSFFIIGLHYAKKTNKIAIITSLILLVSIALNLLLVPLLRLYGAAIVYIISGLLLCVFLYFQSQKHYYIPYELFKVALIALVAISIYLFHLLFDDLDIFIRVLIKLALLVLYPMFLYFLGFYEQVEIDSIRKAWMTWRNPQLWVSNIKRIRNKEIDSI